MNIHKKISPGLTAILFGAITLSAFLLISDKAAAYVAATPQQVQNAAFQFIHRGLIIGDFDGNKVNFIDDNPFDGEIKYEAQNYDCDAHIGGDSGMSVAFALSNLGSYPGSLDPRYIHIEYDAKNGDGCKEARVLKAPAGVDVGMRTWFEWVDAGTIESIDTKLVFTKTGNNDYFLLQSEAGQGCQDRIFTNGNTGKYFELAGDDGLDPSGTDARSLNLSSCDIVGYNFVKSFTAIRATNKEARFNELFKNSFRIGEESNTAKAAGTGASKSQALDGDESSCEGSNNSGLEWAFCGILSLIDKMVEKLTLEIEALLNFDTGKYLNDDVRLAWSIIKNIATILLVIVMLVMIFSQAISVGPFDAYTIRKILPKLVIAVIIMQISFPMLVWFIQLANASGEAVRDLMYAPFGGSSKMQLDDLVGQLGKGTATLSVGAIFTGIAVSVFFSGITIGGAFLLGLTAVLSVLVGLLVLVLRQILIILAVILVPIALVMWILPGTQRYWKLWSDTFIKLLLLFPLIMGMIAAGRIFADIAGDTDNVLAVFVVFVGVFGPLWFLPKAFGWGGQLFSMASAATLNSTKRMRGYPGKYGLEKAKENRQFNAAERAGRLAENRSRFRRFDELLSGRYNVARNQGARVRQFESTRAQGRKAAEEAVAQEIIGSNFERQSHQEKLADLFALAQGQQAPNSRISGSSPVAQRFALDKLAEYGDWDAVTNLRSRGLVDRPIWEAFVAKNISSIHQKAPHLSPLRPDLTELSAEDIPNWHSDTMRELEEQATHGVVRNAGTGMVERSADPAAQRRRAVEQAQRALDNPNIAGRMTREQIDVAQRIVNLAGPELLAADNQAIARSARNNYGRQMVRGRLSPTDQATFEDNVMHIKEQAATSTQARDMYNDIVNAAHNELDESVHTAEQEAIAQSLSPSEVAAARDAAQTRASQQRERLDSMGMIPIPVESQTRTQTPGEGTIILAPGPYRPRGERES